MGRRPFPTSISFPGKNPEWRRTPAAPSSRSIPNCSIRWRSASKLRSQPSSDRRGRALTTSRQVRRRCHPLCQPGAQGPPPLAGSHYSGGGGCHMIMINMLAQVLLKALASTRTERG